MPDNVTIPPSLFISDLHLSEARPVTLQRFVSFIDGQARQAQQLFILGDLFDAWVGDDDASPLAQQVIDALKRLTDHGTRLFVMHGNRDFLIGKTFCQATGATLLEDPTPMTIGQRQVLLTHGDQLCTLDSQYQQARQMRLQPGWVETFLAKPLAERQQIAAAYREQSGEAKSLLAADIMDVTPGAVIDWFEKYQVELMIHGHTHRPDTHHYESDGKQLTRIVLPEWHDDKALALGLDAQGNPMQLVVN